MNFNSVKGLLPASSSGTKKEGGGKKGPIIAGLIAPFGRKEKNEVHKAESHHLIKDLDADHISPNLLIHTKDGTFPLLAGEWVL